MRQTVEKHEWREFAHRLSGEYGLKIAGAITKNDEDKTFLLAQTMHPASDAHALGAQGREFV